MKWGMKKAVSALSSVLPPFFQGIKGKMGSVFRSGPQLFGDDFGATQNFDSVLNAETAFKEGFLFRSSPLFMN